MHAELRSQPSERRKQPSSPVGQQRVVKHRWTPKEDSMLLDAIAVRGPHNWSAIALQIPDRNEKQCRERWVNQLRPDMRKGGWSIQEDAKIIEMFTQVGSSWSEIAKRVPGRTDQAIKNRYNNYLKPKEGRKPLPHAEQLYANAAAVAAASVRLSDHQLPSYSLAHYKGCNEDGNAEDEAATGGGDASRSARDCLTLPTDGCALPLEHPDGASSCMAPTSSRATPSTSAGRASALRGALGGGEVASDACTQRQLGMQVGAANAKTPGRASRRREADARSRPLLETELCRLRAATPALRVEQADLLLTGEAIDEMVYTSTLLTLVASSEDMPDRDRMINRLIGSLAACVHNAAEVSALDGEH